MQTKEERNAEKLAKLEAWKRNLAERKQKELQGAAGTRSLLEAIDKRAAGSNAAVTASPGSPALQPSASTPEPDDSSKPYAGKFDPKAIARKATANSAAPTTLGTDISVPGLAKAAPTSTPSGAGVKADKTSAAGPNPSNGESTCSFTRSCLASNRSLLRLAAVSALPKSRGNVSGFGLGGRPGPDADKGPTRRALELGEEESKRKKLERLPTPPIDDGDAKAKASDVNAADNGDEDEDDDDVDMQVAGTEEETAAAARLAAEKREERLHNENLAHQTDQAAVVDTQMADANGHVTDVEDVAQPADRSVEAEPPTQGQDEADEDIDALDAFMSGLSDPARFGKDSSTKFAGPKSKQAQQQPEALFGDDEVNLNALDANPGDILAMASKARKKKDIPAVNHAKMNYEAFRKKFYTEPAELAALTEEEAADLRLELEGIKIRVRRAPHRRFQPIRIVSFHSIGQALLSSC